MSKFQEQEIKFAKAVYGKDKYERVDTVQFGNKILVGWYMCGYPTLADLEKEFSDKQILELHRQANRWAA